MAKVIRGSAWCDYYEVEIGDGVVLDRCTAPDTHKCKVVTCPVYPIKL